MKCLVRVIGVMLVLGFAGTLNAQVNSDSTQSVMMDVVVLKFLTEQRLVEIDSTGKNKPSRYSRSDTTMTILSPTKFLTENCSKSGCYTYLFDTESRRMSKFNWEGIYSTIPIDSISYYTDSIERLGLPERFYHVQQMRRFFEATGLAQFFKPGWERDVLLDKVPSRPMTESEKNKFSGKSESQMVTTEEENSVSDTTPKKKRGRPNRKSQKKADQSLGTVFDITGGTSRQMTPSDMERFSKASRKSEETPEEIAKQKLLILQSIALSGAIRDGGMSTKYMYRSSLDSVSYTVDSTLSVDTILNMTADRFDWNWTSQAYSLSGVSSVVPRSQLTFDLASQSVFDDNLAIFSGLFHPDRLPVLMPMGRRFWNERGLCASQQTTLQIDSVTFEISRRLLEIEPMRVSIDAFIVPQSYKYLDWISFELEQILLSFYEK